MKFDLIMKVTPAPDHASKTSSTSWPWASGSVPDSIQAATSQLAEWLKHDYHLSDSEVAVVLGTIVKYDIAELVDPQFNVVAKVPKAALQQFQ